MKKLGLWLLLLGVVAGVAARAQAPTWRMLMVGRGESRVKSLARDAAGNLYLVGNFTDTLRLGNLTLTTRDPDGALFVAKWNPGRARFAWAWQAGAPNQLIASKIAVHGTSVYVLASYWGDTLRLGATLLTTGGSMLKGSYFVAKLTDEKTRAQLRWVSVVDQRATSRVTATALAVRGRNVFVGGNFQDSATIFGSSRRYATKGGDLFVAKLTDQGSTARLRWVQPAGATAPRQLQALAVRGRAVYVAGVLPKTASRFGPGVVVRAGQRNAYVAKLRDTGPAATWVWAQRIGSADNNRILAVAVQGARVYVAGNCLRYGYDEPAAADSTGLASDGSSNVFVAKMVDKGRVGQPGWALRIGGAGQDFCTSLLARGSRLYVAGRTSSDSLRAGRAVLASADTTRYADNALVARLTDEGGRGAVDWMQQAGGQSYNEAADLVLRKRLLYVCGEVGGGRLGRTDAISCRAFLAVLPEKAGKTGAKPAPAGRPARTPARPPR